MESGSFDRFAHSKIEALRQLLEFQKKAQAEIGEYRSRYAEEMHQRITVLEHNQLLLLRLLEALAAKMPSLEVFTADHLQDVVQNTSSALTECDTLSQFLKALGFRDAPEQSSMYSSFSPLSDLVEPPPEEFLRSLESGSEDVSA